MKRAAIGAALVLGTILLMYVLQYLLTIWFVPDGNLYSFR